MSCHVPMAVSKWLEVFETHFSFRFAREILCKGQRDARGCGGRDSVCGCCGERKERARAGTHAFLSRSATKGNRETAVVTVDDSDDLHIPQWPARASCSLCDRAALSDTTRRVPSVVLAIVFVRQKSMNFHQLTWRSDPANSDSYERRRRPERPRNDDPSFSLRFFELERSPIILRILLASSPCSAALSTETQHSGHVETSTSTRTSIRTGVRRVVTRCKCWIVSTISNRFQSHESYYDVRSEGTSATIIAIYICINNVFFFFSLGSKIAATR